MVSSPPRIYFRPENGDARFIASLPERPPFDAAIVPARYLAPYPEADYQGDPDALPTALAARHLQFLVDPGTPELAMPAFVRRASPRLRQSPIATALPQPLAVEQLKDEGARNHFVDVVLSTQVRAAALAPPHVELQVRDEGEVAINLAMFERARSSTPGRRVVMFLQCTAPAFRRGTAAHAARPYAAAGVDHVILRVRSLRNEEMSREDFERYLDVIAAFGEVHVEVTIDCTGRAGPPLVAGGAHGFATGWPRFRSVAKRPFGNGGGGSERGRYEIPGAFADAPTHFASVFAGHCSVAECRAHEWNASPFALRLHFLHVLRAQAELAAAEGLAYGSRLRGAGVYAPAWGLALIERARRIA